jgi:hypothetical protein
LGGWKLLLTTPSFGAKSVLKSMSLLKLIVKEKVEDYKQYFYKDSIR